MIVEMDTDEKCSMFFQLLYMHLYRPFLKYTRSTSPLPAHISPRKYCTQAAGAVAKLLRLYKRTHGLRQICNIAIYIAHSACTIHLLNLPDKNARRDIIHGIKHLEEMGECWTAARRTLGVLQLCAQRWNIEMPDEAEMVFTKARAKWGIVAGGNAAPSPISPQSMANLAKQIAAQPVPDLMAHNVQYQQRQNDKAIQRPRNSGGLQAMPDVNSAPTTLPTSTQTVDPRRSSSSFSMPAQSTDDMSYDVQGARSSVAAFPPAQQDTWTSGVNHARMPSNASAVAAAVVAAPVTLSPPGNVESSRGDGVDGLLEETQDWFFKDQSQLAMGFENWGEPQQDWGTLDLSFFGNAGDGGTTGQKNINDGSPAYNGGPGGGEGVGGGMHYSYTGNTSGAYGGQVSTVSTSNNYNTHQTIGMSGMNHGMNVSNMTNPNLDMNMGMDLGIGMDLGHMNMGGGPGSNMMTNNSNMGGLKRPMQSQDMTFDDESYY